MVHKIFVSHKARDKGIADEFAKILRKEIGKTTKIFISDEITKGSNWRDNIRNEINDSDFIILLFTDSTEDWSWCFYEVGLFDAFHDKGGIFLFRNTATKIPSPLAHLQDIKTESEDILEWLSELYKKTDQ